LDESRISDGVVALRVETALYTGNSGASERGNSILRRRLEALVRGNEGRVLIEVRLRI
jgi:hypothetical protein